MKKSQMVSEQESRIKMRAWLNNGTVEREPFTMTFHHETFFKSSADLFQSVVEALDGWIYTKNEFYAHPTNYRTNGRKVYHTVAVIPAAVDWAIAIEQKLYAVK